MIANYIPPVILQNLFKDFIWYTSNNKILLTFDDGPTKETTPLILELLASNGIKAVFFCIGKNISENPDLTNQMIEEGHVIANHTMTHQSLIKLSRKQASEEIRSFNELIKNKFNYNVRFFRPPYGRFNLRTNVLLQEFSLRNVMWNLLSRDYENDFEKVKFGIDKYLKSNSILVFHDNLKSNSIIEESLDYTISAVSKNKLQFGDPEECLK